MKKILLSILLSAPSVALSCPTTPANTDRYEGLYAQLQETDEAGAQSISSQLWELWLQAPDSKAQALLDAGMRLRQSFDYPGARDTLGALISYCPDYAEGYNQRAFASFLARDFQAALDDLDEALMLNPRHLGALTGKGLTLLGLGREAEANVVLREALSLNPWLAERALLTDTDI